MELLKKINKLKPEIPRVCAGLGVFKNTVSYGAFFKAKFSM